MTRKHPTVPALALQKLIVPLATVLAGLCIAAAARAAAFTALDCPRYPAFQQVMASYATSELAQDFNRPYYANWIFNDRRIYANSLVEHIFLKWSSFSIEDGWDYFYQASNGAPPGTWQTFTGNVSTSPFYHTALGYNGQITPLFTRFTTDDSVAWPGFTLEKVGVSCLPNSFIGAGALRQGERVMGVLTGTNDSVTFSLPAASSTGGSRTTNFILWSDTPGVDVDLYVRCNAYPTTDTYTARGYSSDAQEFVRASAGQCAPGGTWYITVHGYSGGPGQFNLMTSYNFASREITVNAKVWGNPNQVPILAQQVADAQRRVFGYTEGGYWIAAWNVCSQTATQCNGGSYHLNRYFNCARSSSDYETHTITLCNDASGSTIAHELGHAVFGLADEYQDVGSPPVSYAQCGHTMMGIYAWWQNNFCWAYDHNRDWDWHASGPSWLPFGNWSTVAGLSQLVPTEVSPITTPDNVAYTNHDFNSWVWVFQYI
jgi:Bacterial pre-peptidase C-terminal domain